MPFSTYWRNAMLNRFRGTAVPTLGTLYLALHSSDPGPDDAATELPIGTGGYARIAVGTSTSDWTAPATSGGRQVISNVNTLTGGTATANLNGGNPITHVSLRDASTAGNQIANGALGTPQTILSGSAITFPPGSIVLSLT